MKKLFDLIAEWKKYTRGCGCQSCEAYLTCAEDLEPVARELQLHIATLERIIAEKDAQIGKW